MSIFLLKPECKDYLWGGHKLVDEYGIDFDGEICAEAWVLSCHPDGKSIIENGAYNGCTLFDVIEKDKCGILGVNCEKYKDFPILIKLIDAKKSLSIQVHPDDEYALKNENQYGKTEMWYVLEAEEGAFLYQGFEKEITKEEFETRIKNNTLEEVLHKVYVNKGDMIFISPGTLHAIGAGILVAEIQQSSNVTYRIYDYGRVGQDGKQRQLHIKQATEVTNLERTPEYVNKDGHLASCEYFCVDKINIMADKQYNMKVDEKSFVSILVVNGECTVTCNDEKVTAKKGQSVFITANSGVLYVEGNSELLVTNIP